MGSLFASAANRCRGAVAAIVAVIGYASTADAAETIPLHDAISSEGAGCIEVDSLVEHLRSWLGGPTIDARIAIRIRQSDAPPRVSFEIFSSGELAGRRKFDAIDAPCDELRAVVALGLAVALDETLLKAAHGGAPTARAPADEPPPPAPRAAIGEPTAPEPAVGIGAEAELMGFAGTLPGLAGGGGADVEVASPRWAARLGGLAAWGERTKVGPGSATTRILAVEIEGCARSALGALRVGVCPGFAIGQFRALGAGFAQPLEANLVWSALVLRLEGRVMLSSAVGIAGSVVLLGHLTRPRLDVVSEDRATLLSRESGIASLIFGVGPFVRFR